MKVTTLFILLGTGLFSYAQDSQMCRLIVRVEAIKTLKGNLKLGIYDRRENFLKTAVVWDDQKISSNTVTFTIDSLKKGIYAVSIFQDEDNNGKLNKNFIGIPTEPYAFSNNAKGIFDSPDFSDCQFEISEENQVIVINL